MTGGPFAAGEGVGHSKPQYVVININYSMT